MPHWCNRSFSDLVNKANIVSDPAERTQLYVQAQQVFHDDVPGLVFADARAFVGVRNNVKGYKLHFLGGQPFGGVETHSHRDSEHAACTGDLAGGRGLSADFVRRIIVPIGSVEQHGPNGF